MARQRVPSIAIPPRPAGGAVNAASALPSLFDRPPKRPPPRRVLALSAPLATSGGRADFVARCLKEFYDASRSAAACKSRAKRMPDGLEKIRELDAFDRHHRRAAAVFLTLCEHSTFPERAP